MVQPYVSAAVRWLKDTGERAVRAAVAAFAGGAGAILLALAGGNVSTAKALATAAFGAALAAAWDAVVSVVAKRRGSPASASLLKE